MQSRQSVWRSACHARNAYSPVVALRVAFGTSERCRQDQDEGFLPSSWEVPATKLPANELQHDPDRFKAQIEENYKKKRRGFAYKRLVRNRQPGASGEQEQEDAAREPQTHKPREIAREIYNDKLIKRWPHVESKPQLQVHEHNKDAAAESGRHQRTQHPEFASHESWKDKIAYIRQRSFRYQRVDRRFDERARTLGEEQPVRVEYYLDRRFERRGVGREKFTQFMDYDPLIVRPEPSKVSVSLPIPWALDDQTVKTNSPEVCLAREIKGFVSWLSPTTAEQQARSQVVQEVKALVEGTLGSDTNSIELFGSEKNGIALPFSDLDFRFTDPTAPQLPRRELSSRLFQIKHLMMESGKFRLVTVRTGIHPILNCQHEESGTDIQIVANEDPAPQQKAIIQAIQQVPNVREIYYLIRTVLGMRGLVDVFAGGIGSYGTFVMVLAILARGEKSLQSRTSNVEDKITNQLQALLAFYGRDGLDTRKHGVAVRPRTLFLKRNDNAGELTDFSALAENRGDLVRAGQWELCRRSTYQPYLLCLQDPANPTNDLGKKAHAIKHIQATLKHLEWAIQTELRFLRRWREQEVPAVPRSESMLSPLVGRCHEVYYERRKKLEEYGAGLERE